MDSLIYSRFNLCVLSAASINSHAHDCYRFFKKVLQLLQTCSARSFRWSRFSFSLSLLIYQKLDWIVQESVRSLDQHLQVTQDFLSQGLIHRNEALVLEVQLAQLHQDLMEARLQIELATIRLNRLMGLDLTAETEIEDLLPDQGPKDCLDQLIEAAKINHPDLLALKAQIEAAQHGYKAEKANLYPSIYAFSNYSTTSDYALPYREGFDAGIGIDFNLYDGGNTSAKLRRIKKELNELEWRYQQLENTTRHQKVRHTPEVAVKHVILEDGSLLLFQLYDLAKEQFFDAYWIESVDSIYRIKHLSPQAEGPVGYFVDHLVRQPNGELLQQAAYKEYGFKKMHFNPEVLQSTIIDPDVLSMTELAAQQPDSLIHLNDKESKIATAFYWKLLMPWLCLLAILAPAPICIRFSRQLPVFFIYVGSLFGLIAFYMFMDAAQVVAKRQVIPPLWAIGFPFLGMFTFFGYRFAKINSAC